jgi:hypothetical protein
MRLSFPTLQELQSVHTALAWLLAGPNKTDGDILAAARASGLILSDDGPHWKVDGDIATRLAEAGLTRLPSDPDRFVNKAPLASGTNRFIRGDAPSIYLVRIQKSKQVSSESLDQFVTSHVIPVAELRADDFDGFIRRRATALLELIESAMGKAVSGRDSEETVKAFGGALV